MNEDKYDALFKLFHTEPEMALQIYEASDEETVEAAISSWTSTADTSWNNALIQSVENLYADDIYAAAEDFVTMQGKDCCSEEDSRFELPYVHIPVYGVIATQEEKMTDVDWAQIALTQSCGCDDTPADPRMAEWERKYSV